MIELSDVLNNYNENNVPEWLKNRYKQAQEAITALKSADFKPLFYTVMMCEDTFIFATREEAHAAFERFEKPHSGWWYGADEFFNKSYPDYLKDFDVPKEEHYYVLVK